MQEYIEKFKKIKEINSFLDNDRAINNCFVVLPFLLNGTSKISYNNGFSNIYEKIKNKDLSAIKDIEVETIGTALLQKAGRTRFLKSFNNFNNLLNSAIECISFENYIGAISILSLIIEPLEGEANKYLNDNFKEKLNKSLFEFVFFNIKITNIERELFFNGELSKINYINISDDIKLIYTQIENFCKKETMWLKHKENLERYFMYLKFISVFLNSSRQLKEIFWRNRNKNPYEFFNRNKIAHTFSFFNNIFNKDIQYKIIAGLFCLINYFIEILFIGEDYYQTNGISILDNISELLPTEEISSENMKYYEKIKNDFFFNINFVNFKNVIKANIKDKNINN